MSWLKADDKLHGHPKVKRIPRRLRLSAMGLWLMTGTWAADYETDGAVPSYILDDFGGEDEVVDALVEVGLWDRTDDGIVFHDWASYQPTRATKDERRAATAERVRKHRQEKRNHTENPVTSGNGNAVTGGGVTPVYNPPVPEPVPVPTTTPQPPGQLDLLTPESPRKRGSATVYPDAFEAWWAAWPKRRTDSAGKKAAFTAWKRATSGTKARPPRVTAAALQAATERYAADPNLPPEQFIPNATTWLNGDRWGNGPCPPRGGPGGGRPDALAQGLDTVARLRAQREANTTTPQLEARRTA